MRLSQTSEHLHEGVCREGYPVDLTEGNYSNRSSFSDRCGDRHASSGTVVGEETLLNARTDPQWFLAKYTLLFSYDARPRLARHDV